MDIADDATLIVTVRSNGVDKVTSELAGLGATGEAAASRFSAAFEQSSASAEDFARAGANAAQVAQLTGLEMGEARNYVQVYGSTAAVTAAEIRGLTLAQQEMAMAGMGPVIQQAGNATLGLGRLRTGLASLASRSLGLSPILGRLGSSIGAFAVGNVAMIAVLAGVAALAKAYEAYTAKAREAQEQQDKATDSLKKWYAELYSGGERAQQVAATQKDLAQQQAKLAELQAPRTFDFSDSGDKRIAAQIAEVRAKIAEDQRVIAAGQGDVVKTEGDAFDAQVQRHSAALAEEVKFHGDDAKVRAAALKQLAEDQALEAQYRKAGNVERAADYARMVKQLDDALNPKEKSPGAAPKETNPVILGLQKQLEEMRKVAEEENIANVQRSYSIRLVGTEGEYRAILLAQEHAEIETIKAYHELSGIALHERLATIEADKQAAVAVAVLTEKQREYLQTVKDVAAIGRRNEAIAKEEIDAAAKKVKDAQAYHDELEKIARTSIERILSHGMKSWQDFFGDVLKGFESMMHAMEAEAKKHNTTPGGAGYTALQYGTIAVSSALAGYDIAKQTGNRAESIIGGAASGAEIGGSIAGPPGAFIGAMAGTIGALVGLHKSASELDDEMRKMRLGQDQIALSLAQWRAQITGTAADQKAAAQLALKVQYEQLIQTIESTEAGKKQEVQRNADLAEAAKLYQDAQAKLTASTLGLTDAMFNAVQGYKYQAAVFGAAPAQDFPRSAPSSPLYNRSGSGSASSSSTNGSGDLTVHVVMPDGSALGTAVLKDFKKRAGQQKRDTSKWSQIQ